MTVHLIGRRSYLAGILEAHLRDHLPVARVAAGDFDPGQVRAGDWVVNCAFDPALHEAPAGPDLGRDGTVARTVAPAGARYVMLSSRAVYAPRVDPPLAEDEPPAPATAYGRNKASIEAGLQSLLGERLLVLRLANVFGEEPPERRTFVSMALGTLIARGEIELRMARETAKDFLPAWLLGRAARMLISSGATGTFNVGSGIALSVGEVADALVRGFGRGDVRVTTTERGEEFLLDTAKLRARTGLTVTRERLLEDLENAAREQRQQQQ